MKFTVEPHRTANNWNVVNPRGKVVHTDPDRTRAEDIARQAMLLSGESDAPHPISELSDSNRKEGHA